MAQSTSQFNQYVEEGSKLESFKSFFQAYESIGKTITTAKGIIGQIKNFKSTLRSTVASNLSVNSKINGALKDLGLTDKAIKALNSATGGLLSSGDAFVMSLYDTVESYASSVIGDVLTALGSMYLPESYFLWTIKALAATGSDPNYNNTLRKVSIKHDLVDTLRWLDDYNGLVYDIDCKERNDSITAAKYGSFQCATYICECLKKAYKKLDNEPVLTKEDQEALDILKYRYKAQFNKTIRYIFTYSYDNLTLSKFKGIIDTFDTFVPSALGTSDKVCSKRDLITSADINILAPFYIVNTGYSKKTYINPRNQNIKKLYVWLAFSTDYTDTTRLIHENLHKRLKYPILTTLEKARYAAEKTLRNSPLGKYIAKLQEEHESLIAQYILKIENILFNPKKQAYLQGEDTTIIPDFRPDTSTSTAAKTAKNDSLPYLTVFSKYYLSYTDFEVYMIQSGSSKAQVAEDTASIIRMSSIIKFIYDYDVNRYEASTNVTSVEQYLIFYGEKFRSALKTCSDDEKSLILRCVMCKYIIDLYTPKGYTLETLAVMYPFLNDGGLIGQFATYRAAIVDTSTTTQTADGNGGTTINGNYVNYSSLAFYTKVLYSDGIQIIIEDSGINVYDSTGTKVRSIGKQNGIDSGTPQAVAVKEDAVFIYMLNADGSVTIYVSTDGAVTFTKDSVIKKEALNVYAGTGVTSITQINFFKAFMYDGKIFTATSDKGIGVSENNAISYITKADGLMSNDIYGLAFMLDGKLYYICSLGVFQVADYKARPLSQVKVGEYVEGAYVIVDDQIGTVLKVVTADVDTVDDFDIDDTEVVSSIISYYQTNKHMYYIFGQLATTDDSKNDDITPKDPATDYTPSTEFKDYVQDNTKTNVDTTAVTPVYSSFEDYLASCTKK